MANPTVTDVPSPNYRAGRQGWVPDVIVDHIMQGTLAGTDAWFANPASEVSAHYGVGKGGEIHKYVLTSNQAWHAGEVKNPTARLVLERASTNPNLWAIGVEHEGHSGDALTDAQYEATLWLHKQLLVEFPRIVLDRDHLILHHEIDANHGGCPGQGFPIDRLLADLRSWDAAGRPTEEAQV